MNASNEEEVSESVVCILKTPYSFDTHSILCTPASDVHRQLKTTTGKAIRKRS